MQPTPDGQALSVSLRLLELIALLLPVLAIVMQVIFNQFGDVPEKRPKSVQRAIWGFGLTFFFLFIAAISLIGVINDVVVNEEVGDAISTLVFAFAVLLFSLLSVLYSWYRGPDTTTDTDADEGFAVGEYMTHNHNRWRTQAPSEDQDDE